MEVFAEAPQTRVLVVRSEPQASVRTAAALQRAGFEVAFAASGYEALAAVRAARHNVVVVDAELPDMRGAELARILRSDPEAVGMRIHILGAAASQDLPRYTGRRRRQPSRELPTSVAAPA